MLRLGEVWRFGRRRNPGQPRSLTMVREGAALWLRRELSLAWAKKCSLVKRGLAEDKALWLRRKYTSGWVEIFALIMH